MRLALYAGGILGAFALVGFGVGFAAGQFRALVKETDARGYERGAAETALAQRTEIDRLQQAAETEKRAAEARAKAAIEQQARQLAEIQIELEKALADPVNFSCDARPYPVGLRINAIP